MHGHDLLVSAGREQAAECLGARRVGVDREDHGTALRSKSCAVATYRRRATVTSLDSTGCGPTARTGRYRSAMPAHDSECRITNSNAGAALRYSSRPLLYRSKNRVEPRSI